MTTFYRSALSRPWDDFDAYLFDIDGTLLSSEDAVHYFAFCEALTMLSGRTLTLDGVVAHGNTDVGILRDALQLAGVPEGDWRPRREEACVGMGEFVFERKGDLRVRVLPGVVEVLEHLQRRGAVIGVATGNLRRIGELKLEAGGLGRFFTSGSYSDADEYRVEVFRRAIEAIRLRVGEHASVCVFGDTPEDVRAARLIEAEVVAVATGVYSVEELMLEEPTACCGSLLELLEEARGGGRL